MIFPPETVPFLKGEKFSSGLVLSFRREHREVTGAIPDRIGILMDCCRGKRVIHLGCCDHVSLISEKRKNGTWLHDLLSQCSSECLGIDIDPNAVDFVTNELGISNVILADLSAELPQELTNGTWDILIAGEILEHTGNPLSFLQEVRAKIKGHVAQIVITVPNALRFHNVLHSFRNQEFINSDHRYWFTPYTLAKIMCDAGIEPVWISFVNSWKEKFSLRKWRRKLRCFLQYRYPMMRDTLIVCGTLE